MGKILKIGVCSVLFQLGFSTLARADSHPGHHPWFSHSEAGSTTTLAVPLQDNEAASSTVQKDWKNEPHDKVGKEIAHQALRYQGVKYRFGGNSKSKGFDCSGLVARVYHDLKMQDLPHMTTALYRRGKPVKMSELRPGDLVFFKNTYRSGISHVGIYAGNNRFVHARNHRAGVTVTLLSDPYFQLHYAGARRLY